MQGNPIKLTDPFGLCSDISISGIGHAPLDLLGIIPGMDLCDGINVAWYFFEGDYSNAALSTIAVVPMLGSIAGSGIKWGAKGIANANKVADTVKAGSRIIGNAGALIQSGGQTLESVGNLYGSYVKDGEIISWKNATDLITLGLSVAGMGMAGKSLAKDGKALKAVSQGNVNVKPAAVSNSTKDINQKDTKGLLSDYLKKPVNHSAGKFYSIKNDAGGQVYVSTQGVYQSDIVPIVESTKGRINIISGRHGDVFDNVKLDIKFYEHDLKRFGIIDNVHVYNYAEMDEAQITKLINSDDTTILGWCFSEYYTLMRTGFH